jgi:hypothetical protein
MPSAARKLARTPRLKTFHATMLVTRAEEWWVEAATPEEAQALLIAGMGQRVSLGERVHVDVDEIREDNA